MEEIHMRRNTVTFDDHTYLLSSTMNPADLQRAVIASVTSGVGFVDVDVAGSRSMSVLVTDRVSVTFESEEFDEPIAFIGPSEFSETSQFDLVWN
jgi:hypothetical protein